MIIKTHIQKKKNMKQKFQAAVCHMKNCICIDTSWMTINFLSFTNQLNAENNDLTKSF